MDASRVLFWGVELTPGKPLPFDLNEGEMLHINMASLGETLQDKTGRSVVTARVSDDSPKYALCALTAGKMESFNLDLTFSGEEKVVLEVSGKNVVHLVGNFGFEGEEEGSDMFGDSDDLINEYSDDESQDADDSSEEEPMLLEDDDPPVITEITEDAGVGAGAAKANGKLSKAEKKKQRKKKAEEAAAAAKDKKDGAAGKDDDGSDGEDSEENVGRTDKKAATPEAPKSGGKKRANVADAGQTPAAKKSRGSASDGGGPSGKKASGKKGKAPKAEADGAPSEKASDPEPAAAPAPTKPKGGKGTPAKAADSAAPADAGPDGESAKKRKRRRSKGKGGAGPSA